MDLNRWHYSSFFVRAMPLLRSSADKIPDSRFRTTVTCQILKTCIPGLYYTALLNEDDAKTLSLLDLCAFQWHSLSGYVYGQSLFSLSENILSAMLPTDENARSQTAESTDVTDAGDTVSETTVSDNTSTDTDASGDSGTTSESGTDSDGSGSSETDNNTSQASNCADTDDSGTDNSSDAESEDSRASSDTEDVSDDGGDADSQTVSASGQNYTGVVYSQAQLSDFSFLLNTFYTLDSTTTIDESLLDGETLLAEDMTLTSDNSQPQILIYHTHSQEDFIDSVDGDTSTTIVGVGEYLANVLSETYGYNVIHNTDAYDLVDGELDRNKAYSQALKGVSAILEEYPSIEIVIDLHRDGIEGEKMTTTVNGKETARFMFFNGLSRTAKNGEISYLYNPYIQDNLAFSLQLQLMAAKYYPGVTRPIYLKGYRYNLHLRPRSLLVEVGSQKNTYEEAINAMDVLADILDKVLQGEE